MSAAPGTKKKIAAPLPAWTKKGTGHVDWGPSPTGYLRIARHLPEKSRNICEVVQLVTAHDAAWGKRARPTAWEGLPRDLAKEAKCDGNSVTSNLKFLLLIELVDVKKDGHRRIITFLVENVDSITVEQIEAAKATIWPEVEEDDDDEDDAGDDDLAVPAGPARHASLALPQAEQIALRSLPVSEPLVLMPGEDQRPRPLSEVCRTADCGIANKQRSSTTGCEVHESAPALGNGSNSPTAWEVVQAALRLKLAPVPYENVVHLTKQIGFDAGVIRVAVSQEYSKEMLESEYAPIVAAELANVGAIGVAYEIAPFSSAPQRGAAEPVDRGEFDEYIRQSIVPFMARPYTDEESGVMEKLRRLPVEYIRKVFSRTATRKQLRAGGNEWEFVYGLIYYDAWDLYVRDLAGNDKRFLQTLRKMGPSPGKAGRSGTEAVV